MTEKEELTVKKDDWERIVESEERWLKKIVNSEERWLRKDS
jgi:hypothetical protein